MTSRSVQEADDLVQATVVRALRAETRFELGTNMRAWLYRILCNLHISELRNRSVRPHQTVDETPEVFLKAPATQIAAIEHKELRKALKTLSRPHHEALVLVVVAGHTYDEASAICGCAIGTIKSRVNRAKTALAVALAMADAAAPEHQASTN